MSTTAYHLWTNALKKSGYFKKDTSTDRLTLHTHCLRKSFRTKLGSVIPVDVVEALMGHAGYLTEVYRKHSDEDLAKFYQKGKYSLMVFGSEDVSKLKEEVDEKNKQLKDVLATYVTVNINLKSDNLSIRNDLDDLRKKLNEIYQIIKQ